MQSLFPAPESPKWVRFGAFFAPIAFPLLIAFECNVQSMIVFEGMFLALFLFAAAFTLRSFLASELLWPPDRVRAWSKATVLGTITALFLTLAYAFRGADSLYRNEESPGGTYTVEYLAVAIAFALILALFQAFAIRTQVRWPALWAIIPPVASVLSYGASILIERLGVIERTGLVTLFLALAASFIITLLLQRASLKMLSRRSTT